MKDEAVSPVVGTIILVCITLILAAMLGAFVFGIVESPQKNYNIGITTDLKDGDVNFLITSASPETLTALNYISVEINGDLKPSWEPNGVGSYVTYPGSYSRPCHVVLIGHFGKDDQQKIVLNTNI